MGRPNVEAATSRVQTSTMKAAVYSAYGTPDEVTIQEVPIPSPGSGEVLVKVGAAAVNPGDMFMLEGTPLVLRLSTGLRRPRRLTLGVGLAGVVVRAGSGAQSKPGAEIFAEVSDGAFAGYAIVSDDMVAHKPESASFEEAAAVPVCGVTALQALRDIADVRSGQEVLITGASGGVGSFAVQIGAWLGARVTGVCSTPNVEFVRRLGAAEVIDYTKEDFVAGERRYDVVLDNVANHSLGDLRKVVRPGGTVIPNANKPGGVLGGFIRRAVQASLTSPFVPQRLRPFSSKGSAGDLSTLRDLIEAGTVTPAIDTIYPLAHVADALRHYSAGHTRGKIVVSVRGN